MTEPAPSTLWCWVLVAITVGLSLLHPLVGTVVGTIFWFLTVRRSRSTVVKVALIIWVIFVTAVFFGNLGGLSSTHGSG